MEFNPKDKWRAFYSLYRFIKYKSKTIELLFSLTDSMDLLAENKKFIELVESPGDYLKDLKSFSKELRRYMLDYRRYKRLYGKYHYILSKKDKGTARRLHTKGVEVTPNQVAELRRHAINIARENALKYNLEVPEDDLELLNWLYSRYVEENLS